MCIFENGIRIQIGEVLLRILYTYYFMKRIVSVVVTAVIIFCTHSHSAFAQKKAGVPVNPIPGEPSIVAIDAPIPQPPALGFNIAGDLKFGAQSTGVESCIKVQILNKSNM